MAAGVILGEPLVHSDESQHSIVHLIQGMHFEGLSTSFNDGTHDLSIPSLPEERPEVNALTWWHFAFRGVRI
jgi:hypothetical protein